MDWLDMRHRQALAEADEPSDAEAVREDERVLAHVVHQLATVTHVVRGTVEMLHPHVTEAGAPALERLERQTQSLTHLVTNLLEFWRHKAGADIVRQDRVAVREVCERARALAAALIGNKEVTVTASVAPGAEWVVSDREKLERILSNLAGNAAKYTARGRIEIGARRANGRVRLTVRDTGIGVAPGDREKIFLPFYQGARGETPSHVGIGLGLALAQDLARFLGTRIAVDGANGAGATFFLDLPAAPV